jgi:hypothetical protein
MHSPNAVLIISKRKIAGPELPDFGGESFESARKGALMDKSPCELAAEAAAEAESPDETPDKPEMGYQEQLTEIKQLAAALQDAVESLEPAQEGSGTGKPDKTEPEASHGAAKVFKPAE